MTATTDTTPVAAPAADDKAAEIARKAAEAKAEQDKAKAEYDSTHDEETAEIKRLWDESDQNLTLVSVMLSRRCALFVASGQGNQTKFTETVGLEIGRSSSSVWKYVKAGNEAKRLGLTEEQIRSKGITPGMLEQTRSRPEASAKAILAKRNLSENKVAGFVKAANEADESEEDKAANERKATEALERKLRDKVYGYFNGLSGDESATEIGLGFAEALGEAIGFKGAPNDRMTRALTKLVNDWERDSSDEETPDPAPAHVPVDAKAVAEAESEEEAKAIVAEAQETETK